MATDVKMEGKTLNEFSQERMTQAAKLADECVPQEVNEIEKPLTEEHYLKLYWFKTEHDKLSAGMQMLRQQLQDYGKSIILSYFPNANDAVINLEKKSISRKSLIETPKVQIEVPK